MSREAKKQFKLGYEPGDFDIILEELEAGASVVVTDGKRSIELVQAPAVVQ